MSLPYDRLSGDERALFHLACILSGINEELKERGYTLACYVTTSNTTANPIALSAIPALLSCECPDLRSKAEKLDNAVEASLYVSLRSRYFSRIADE